MRMRKKRYQQFEIGSGWCRPAPTRGSCRPLSDTDPQFANSTLMWMNDGELVCSISACRVLDIGMPGLSGYEMAKRIRLEAWGPLRIHFAACGRSIVLSR